MTHTTQRERTYKAHTQCVREGGPMGTQSNWPHPSVKWSKGESAEGHGPTGTIQESQGDVKGQCRRQCQGAVTTDRTDSTVEGWEFLPHPPRPYWSGFQADGRSCRPSSLPNVAANVAILGVGRLEGGARRRLSLQLQQNGCKLHLKNKFLFAHITTLK